MFKPLLEDAKALIKENTLIPISTEIFSDSKTPIEVFRNISKNGENAYILESVENGESWGRYTFLGYNPAFKLSGRNSVLTIMENGEKREQEGNIHKLLEKEIRRHKSAKISELPPFCGGFVGYFSYEYLKHVEPSFTFSDVDKTSVDDFCLMMFDKVIAFDHFKQKIILIANISTENIEKSYEDGVLQLIKMKEVVLSSAQKNINTSRLTSEFSQNHSKENFCEAAKKIKECVFQGDVLKCVPSIRFKADFEGDLLQSYRVLRTTNPSAHMFDIRFDGMEIAGASRETLVSLKDGVITQAIISEKSESVQEAEHDILLDMSRSDIGKVSKFGTVNVSEHKVIKKCLEGNIFISKITGELSDDKCVFDVIAAVSPPGKLTGAPKKSAIALTSKLEATPRGVFGGGIGYLDFSGNMELCIGVTMAVLKDKTVFVQAGVSISNSSIPENEYEKCLHEAKIMIEAVKASEEARA